MNPTPGQNTGIIIKPLDPTSWIVSGETGIAPVVLEQGAQWDLYLPDEESQGSYDPVPFDGDDCVTFSATNNLEILLQRLRTRGQLPATHETFLQNNNYISKATGKVNFSDRFTAKMSGTTRAGNNLAAVGDSIRSLHGLLGQADWDRPTFPAGSSTDQCWALYYEDVPQDLQAKAKKFLDMFSINYQWIAVGSSTASQLKEQLKYGPMQIASEVCPDWGVNPGINVIKACGSVPGHGTTLYGYDDAGDFKDFDSYKGFRKLLAVDYSIPYALQYTIIPKVAQPTPVFHHVFNTNLYLGMPAGGEVQALQNALQSLKDKTGVPYMKQGVFGPYGPATKLAVAHLQADNGIVDDGSHVGPKTRLCINTLLAA